MTADEVFWNALAHFVRAQRPRLSMREEERAQPLQSLLRHAAERVPLYRDLYRANKIDIEAVRAPNDLWRLPSVSKSDYVRAGPGSYTDGADTLLDAFVQKTSGSTGPPLSIFARPREAQILLANFWSAWVAAGSKSRTAFFSSARVNSVFGYRISTSFFVRKECRWRNSSPHFVPRNRRSWPV